jgi:hypothetical protein
MLQNGYVRAEFNADGMLQSITTIDDRKKDKVNLVSSKLVAILFSKAKSRFIHIILRT